MKFKLDENLGLGEARILRDAGLDVATVPDQNLQSAPDRVVIDVCRNEGRCLVTLDAEFGNPLLYPPQEFRGIVLLRLTSASVRESIAACMNTLRDAIVTLAGQQGRSPGVGSLDRALWIVQPGRVRVYQPDGSLRARHPEMTEEQYSLLRMVHEYCSNHRVAVLGSTQCACFYCMKRFAPAEISQWSPDGRTALCPRCGIDSVLPHECGAELTDQLLSQMNQFWFGRLSQHRGDSNASN